MSEDQDSEPNITWIIATVQKSPRKRLAAWQTRAGLAEDGTVYLPAAICGNEQQVFMCATWDGVPLLSWGGHVYLPSDWLAEEYPLHADDVNHIAQRVRALALNTPPNSKGTTP
jgi:hypothetical protein